MSSSAFCDHIAAALGRGPTPAQITAGRLVRFATSEKPHDTAGYAMLFEDERGGIYGCWRSGTTGTWQAYGHLNPIERAAWAELCRQARQKAARIETELRAKCRQKCSELLGFARDVDAAHPYVVSKGIRPYGARQLQKSLLIPVCGSDGALRGLQFIDPDGGKRFKAGTELLGGYLSVGRPSGAILICEGWATGCTLHEATGQAVAVAFNAGNLMHVAKTLRAKYPEVQIIICADDDRGTNEN